jgi:uncharacterized Zn finger protein
MESHEPYLKHQPAIPCPYCSEFLEFYDEGIDAQGQRCDLYICPECGQQIAITETPTETRRPRYPWDPPDGFRSA